MKHQSNVLIGLIVFVVASLALAACGGTQGAPDFQIVAVAPTGMPEGVDAQFVLQTVAFDGKLAFVGVGGEIDGVINPDLRVHPGDRVQIILVNGDGMPHDFFAPDLDAQTDYVAAISEQTEIVFETAGLQPGSYIYYCSIPGHRQSGQEGKLILSQ